MFFYIYVGQCVAPVVVFGYFSEVRKGESVSVVLHELFVVFFCRYLQMAFDEIDFEAVFKKKRQEFLPKFLVFDGLLFGVLPAVLFPAFVPLFPEAVDQVGTVRKDAKVKAFFLQRGKGFYESRQFHAVVGGVVLASAELLFDPGELQYAAPAAQVLFILVPGAGSVRIYVHEFFHADLLSGWLC